MKGGKMFNTCKPTRMKSEILLKNSICICIEIALFDPPTFGIMVRQTCTVHPESLRIPTPKNCRAWKSFRLWKLQANITNNGVANDVKMQGIGGVCP